MSLKPVRAVNVYVGAVALAGLAVIAAAAPTGGPNIGRSFTEFWVLAGLVALGELLPIKVSRLDGDGEIATSTIFTIALLLRFGLGAAIVAQTIASVGADLNSHKPVWKATFNAAQYALSLAAAGLVLGLTAGPGMIDGVPFFGAAELPGILLAATVFFALNNTLTRAAIALDQHSPVMPFLTRDFGYHLSVNGPLLALAPIAVVAAERSLVLVPLLALPMAIIYRSATVYAEKEYKAYQAVHDGLTGLPNRTLFYDRVGQALLEARREATSVAVMLIDLDRFKEINDTLGHHIGDLLLQRIGPRLQTSLRESDTIARLGGDEFAVLLPRAEDADDALRVAEKLCDALEKPFVLEEVSTELTLDVEASIGVALSPLHGDDVDTLIQRADVAMYVAKEEHQGFELYTDERDRNSANQLSMLSELRRGLDEHELVLHFQPQADIATGRVHAVEALLRWQHPRRGLIPPDEFIPVAERTGLIQAVTLYALEAAMRQWQEWQEAGVNLRIAVNLSRRNLMNLRFPDQVALLLAKWNMEPSALELEITESSIMADPSRAAGVLTRLDEMGIRLALDDFGAGYTSLAYLKRLPVGEIKIDKSFVMGMCSDDNDTVIVRSTIDLARNLGLRVVAEGVESLEIWRRLNSLKCDTAQGFYLSRALPGSQVAAWVRRLHTSLDRTPHAAARLDKRTRVSAAAGL